MVEVEERLLPVVRPVLPQDQHGHLDLLSFIFPLGPMSLLELDCSLKIKTTFVLINFDFEVFNPEPSTLLFLVCLLDDIKYLVDAYDMSSNTETHAIEVLLCPKSLMQTGITGAPDFSH